MRATGGGGGGVRGKAGPLCARDIGRLRGHREGGERAELGLQPRLMPAEQRMAGELVERGARGGIAREHAREHLVESAKAAMLRVGLGGACWRRTRPSTCQGRAPDCIVGRAMPPSMPR